MADISVIGSGTWAAANNSNVTPVLHASTAEGDLLFLEQCLHSHAGDGATADGASGYTTLTNGTATSEDTGTRLNCIRQVKVAGSSESNPTCAVTGTNSGDANGCQVTTIRSTVGWTVGTLLAHSETPSTTDDDTEGALPYPGLTVTTDNTIVLMSGANGTNATSIDTISGFTQADYNTTSAGNDIALVLDYQLQTDATTISSGAWATSTESNRFTPEVAFAFSLQEDAGATAPTITSALDCNNTLDTAGFNCTVTVDEDSTGHAVACPINSTAPTVAQIKLGDCTGDADAIEYETTSLTGTMQWSAHFTGLAGRAVYDVYFIATNAGGDSAIGSDLDSFRAARTGYEFITLTSIGAGTWCAQANTADYWDDSGLQIAAGDVLEIEDGTSPSDFAVTNGVDCSLSYSGNGSRQTVSYCPLDATTGANFADPMLSASFYEGCDDLIVFNNAAPQGGAEPYIDVWLSGAAIMDIDLDTVFSDGDGDSMTYEVTTGTLPTGVSLSTNLLTGTPTTSNYPGGVTVTITAYDSFGGSGTQDFDLWVYDAAELTMPDLTDGDINDAIADELSTMPWRDDPTLTTTFACDESVASGTFISQDPAASTQIDPDQVFSGAVSTGLCSQQRRGFGVTFPGIGM